LASIRHPGDRRLLDPQIREPAFTRSGPVGNGPGIEEGRIDEEEEVFRCRRCGSGYHNRIARSWAACPRCLAKDRFTSPLEFELERRPIGARQRFEDGPPAARR
jgi:DNA-directed RNA polymerase subunit RPC12/RpoP